MTQPTNPAFDGGNRQRVPRRWTILFGGQHPGGGVSVTADYLTAHTRVSGGAPVLVAGIPEANMCTRPSGMPMSRIGGPENNSYQLYIEKMTVTTTVAQDLTRNLTVQLMIDGAPVGTPVVIAGFGVGAGAITGSALQSLVATALQRIGVTAQATGAGAANVVAESVTVELDVFER